MKKGRHQVVRMRSGQWMRERQPLADDEYEDAEGNLFRRYPLQDDPGLQELVPTIQTLGRSDERLPREEREAGRKRRPTTGPSRSRCSKCN